MTTFRDHVELLRDAIGPDWAVPIEAATARIAAPVDITKVNCFTGPFGSTLPCAVADVSGATATFSQTDLAPFEALTYTVALPKGSIVPPPKPVLEERFSLANAFSLTPFTLGGAGLLLLIVVGVWALLQYRFGRDRRYVGSAVDVAFGSATGADERVPLLDQHETPVEFVPPDDLRPGQIGTLIDFAANPLDVTATIVDLAVRKFLVIEEIDGTGWTHKADWKLTKLREPGGELKRYELELFNGLFEDGPEVLLSELRQKFAARMQKVQRALDGRRQGAGLVRAAPERRRGRSGGASAWSCSCSVSGSRSCSPRSRTPRSSASR